MENGPFKMKGFSGFGNSPLKQEKQPVGPVETDPMSRFFSKTPPKGTIVPIGEGVVSEEGGGSEEVVEEKKKEETPATSYIERMKGMPGALLGIIKN